MQCFLRVFGLHTPFLTRHLEKTTEHCPVDSQGVAGALIRFHWGTPAQFTQYLVP